GAAGARSAGWRAEGVRASLEGTARGEGQRGARPRGVPSPRFGVVTAAFGARAGGAPISGGRRARRNSGGRRGGFPDRGTGVAGTEGSPEPVADGRRTESPPAARGCGRASHPLPA